MKTQNILFLLSILFFIGCESKSKNQTSENLDRSIQKTSFKGYKPYQKRAYLAKSLARAQAENPGDHDLHKFTSMFSIESAIPLAFEVRKGYNEEAFDKRLNGKSVHLGTRLSFDRDSGQGYIVNSSDYTYRSGYYVRNDKVYPEINRVSAGQLLTIEKKGNLYTFQFQETILDGVFRLKQLYMNKMREIEKPNLIHLRLKKSMKLPLLDTYYCVGKIYNPKRKSNIYVMALRRALPIKRSITKSLQTK